MAIILKEQGVLEYNTGNTLPAIDVIVGTKARDVDTGDKSTWDGTAWVPGWGEGEAPTGLEAIDDGQGTGWRLIGRDPAKYGTIGKNAIDLSINEYSGSDRGAIGQNSFTVGNYVKASGKNSIAIGNRTEANNDNSYAIGNACKADSTGIYFSMALGSMAESYKNSISIGFNTTANAFYSTAMGVMNASYSNARFTIGDGDIATARYENGFELFQSGIVVAPKLTIDKINQVHPTPNVDAGKILVTKEYVDANSGPKVTDITWADLVTKADAGELKVWDKFIVTDKSNLPAEIKFIAPDGSCFIEVMDEAYIVELKKIE